MTDYTKAVAELNRAMSTTLVSNNVALALIPIAIIPLTFGDGKKA
jgi:hypothetical protein